MIMVTERASQELALIIEAERAKANNTDLNLRIFVQGQCHCGATHFGMTLDDDTSPNDTIVEAGTIQVLYEPELVELLDGVELEYVDETMQKGFTLKNLPEKASCNCGHSH